MSVRNAVEARAAVVGSCDLLDIKEPSRGPLGMADRPRMVAIAEFAAGCRGPATPLPCSAALGELVDWEAAGRAGVRGATRNRLSQVRRGRDRFG